MNRLQNTVSRVVGLGLLMSCGVCSAPFDPHAAQDLSDTVITSAGTGPWGGQLYAIKPNTGAVAAWPSTTGPVYGAAISSGLRTVFVDIGGGAFTHTLTALDARRGNVSWTQRLSVAGLPDMINGIGVRTGEVMAADDDLGLLYLWRAVQDTTTGIAALDTKTRRPVAFSGPWNVAAGGLTPFMRQCGSPRRVLMVVASRENANGGPRRGTAMYFLDAGTLQVIDSVLPSLLGSAPAGDIWQALPADDGRTLYVATSTRIVRYDSCSGAVVATAARRGTGALALTHGPGAEQTLVLTDVGVWPDTPGSGEIFLFGPNLDSRGSIDVSTPLGGIPQSALAIVTGDAKGSNDGRTVYVRAGSDEVGPLYAPQPARLLVIDVVSRKLVRVINLTGFGLGPILVSY